MFIAVHHNVTSEQDTAASEALEVIRYTYGWKDACAVFFYFLICIVMHAIIQEYVLDVSQNMLNILVSTVTKYISQYILKYIKKLSSKIMISKITVIFNSQKISRKLHLSKVKHSKFNESGQLLIFYLMSVLWAGDVIFRYVLGIDIQCVFILSPSTAPVTEIYPIESLYLQGS